MKMKNKNIMECVKMVASLAGTSNLNMQAVRSSIQRLVERIAQLKKHVSQHWETIVLLLNEVFPLPEQTVVSACTSNALPAANDSLLPKKVRNQCLKCLHYKTTLNQVNLTKLALCRRLQILMHRKDENRRLKQSLSRKVTIEHKLRLQLRDLKKDMITKDKQIEKLMYENRLLKQTASQREICKLRKSMTVMRSTLVKYRSKYVCTLQNMKKENSTLRKQIDNLKSENDFLSALLEQENSNCISTKVGNKRYSTQCRKAIYACLEYQVPVNSVCPVITAILNELANFTIDFLPEPSTICNWVYELGIISDLQVGEVMYRQKDITLSWDSTSVNGHHINEVHISVAAVPLSFYVLQLNTLPGGTTDDYVAHICDCIDHIARIFSMYHNLDYLHCKSTITSNLKNTLSDRVAVNHCVVQRLQSSFDTELLELKCNVHPLDGIAKRCTSMLKAYDKEHNIKSDTFGRDCCAVNFICAVNKMRYKQGKGDPAGFKQFLRQEGIRRGIIARYVGNRFHIVFHSAGVLYHLRKKLSLYLDTFCHNTTSLRSALQKDIKNDHLFLQLQALGLIGKLVTGPWMKHLYGNQQLSNLDSIPRVQLCLKNLCTFKDSPMQILESNSDVFGMPIDESSDEVLSSLRSTALSAPDKECIGGILLQLITSTIEVIKKQMEEYIDGGLASLPPSNALQTLSAPVHNMFAEKTLGLADHHLRRSQNAKIGFVDGKVKTRINRTLAWLSNKTKQEQDKIVQFSIPQASTMRTAWQKHEENVAKQQDRRHIEKNQKKDATFRHRLEKKLRNVLEGKTELLFEFQELNNDQASIIKNILHDPLCISGNYFEHMWFVNEQNVLYEGHITSVKCSSKSKITKITATYWKPGESEEEGDDVTMTLFAFLVDFIIGDLYIDELGF